MTIKNIKNIILGIKITLKKKISKFTYYYLI